ncbi:ChaN family lipoprotein [Paucibacter sp. PLA-PC-4]|uniref:ChaN family lipoprotein n=1 Tax=Paucibacter sp. PLA-PC-4 TaxID=2993655 RepID=UPI002248F1A3|nr:ChaN family lipoprotein [Paucibacter sp. PLA-PC-4]MCX2860404.1 ChaN family lipoprotein [Paucibacter sp. PLA-PC-4]
MKKTLLLGLLVLQAGCAQLGMTPSNERIVELASGREISRDELLHKLLASDYVLLGEQHDNAVHHQRRAELLSALGPRVPVVAEHMTRGQAVLPGPALLPRLQAAGFDEKGWRWPLHEPLFVAAAAPGRLLVGGNAPREQARELARKGESALPDDLRAVTRAAPLDAAGAKALDTDLVQGHCGMLAGERLVGMGWAQRARDAAMWLSLQAAAQAQGKPAVLVAGNGHVRRDYGVPHLIAAQQPAARVASVGFVETGAKTQGLPYHYVWITAAPAREDACAGMREMMNKQG